MIKDIIIRAVGLLFATFFAGTGVGAIATNGDDHLGRFHDLEGQPRFGGHPERIQNSRGSDR